MNVASERRRFLAFLSGALGVGCLRSLSWAVTEKKSAYRGEAMRLPSPEVVGEVSLEEVIKSRRTVRSFRSEELDLKQLSQIFWAAQGVTADRGSMRAAPSAGALYPMDVYAVTGEGGVSGIEAGVYHYDFKRHRITPASGGDVRHLVARAALSQNWMARAPVCLVITAEYGRINTKYGNRGVRYAMIEAGHIGQNIFLQVESLGLKAGIVGAFDDRRLNQILNIPLSHEPLLVMPVGYRR